VSEAEHTVIAGILQSSSRLADVGGLRPEFFGLKETRALFEYATAYHRKRGRKNALDIPLARSRLEASKSKIALALLELVDDYSDQEPVTEAEFKDALEVLASERRHHVLRRHGAAALEAVIEGDLDAATRRMRRGLVEAGDASLDDDSPVDVRSKREIAEEKRLLEPPEEGEEEQSFDVGFPRITRAVSLRRRELTILGGYSSDGKSQWSKALVYNASRLSRANVLFVALEMSRREMRVLFVAQHAASLDRRGVDYRAILERNASADDRKLYRRALDEFGIEGHEDQEEIRSEAGALIVWSPNKRINMDDFTDRIRAMRRDAGIDIVVGDFLELIQPSRNLGQYRLNLKDMVEESKALAREEGVWMILNHQISRKGRDDAEKRKPRPYYLMRDLGETSGIERAADSFLWVYYDEDLEDDREAIVGVGKARKGRKIVRGFPVFANYSRALIAEID